MLDFCVFFIVLCSLIVTFIGVFVTAEHFVNVVLHVVTVTMINRSLKAFYHRSEGDA